MLGRGFHCAVIAAIAAIAAIAVTGAIALPDAWADRADYVGSKTCGGCHQAAYEAWQKSRHARADQLLGPSPSPACLGCHTTGEAPAGKPFFAAVGCESCHGPGAGYAQGDIMRDRGLSQLLGLRDLATAQARAALCRECHRAETRLEPFDLTSAWRRIEHR